MNELIERLLARYELAEKDAAANGWADARLVGKLSAFREALDIARDAAERDEEEEA